MRAMVSTASTGKRPEAVSADSMMPSVPSRIAFATSDASARVGRAFSIMLSSICVAVITTFPAPFAISMMRFWSVGTSSVESSTPRSPRATITPSVTSSIDGRSSTASRFSIFAITGAEAPWERISCLTSSTSAAWRTKDNAT